MNWEYNGIRIYVVKDTTSRSQEIARLQPLRADTIHHVFGWESRIKKLDAFVVGTTNVTNLATFVESGSSMTLSSPLGSAGDFYLRDISYELLPTVKQTLDISQDCTTPVYRVSLELYKDE